MLSLRIHIDEDLTGPLLATLLRRAGHDVVSSAMLGLAGVNDPVQFTRAIQDSRILLSGKHEDFEELHDLVLAASGNHPGILIVRYDNDRRRDLSAWGVVSALERICLSQVPFANMLHVLNQWRQ